MPCFQHTEVAFSGHTLGSYRTLPGANITCAASNIQIDESSLKIHFHLNSPQLHSSQKGLQDTVKDKNTIYR